MKSNVGRFLNEAKKRGMKKGVLSKVRVSLLLLGVGRIPMRDGGEEKSHWIIVLVNGVTWKNMPTCMCVWVCVKMVVAEW